MNDPKTIAEQLLHGARSQEPKITDALLEIANSHGCRLAGLEFKLKSLDSLIRKIKTDAKLDGLSFDAAGKLINDVLRYTMIFNVHTFGEQYLNIKRHLSNEGFIFRRVKNTWLDNNTYNGVNTNIEFNGLSFELQFHTQESFDLKNGLLHNLYEERRQIGITQQRQLFLDKQMVSLSQKLEIPNGIKGVE